MASNPMRVITICFILYLNTIDLNAELVSFMQTPCYKENAPECNGFGNYNCGTCECDAHHTGRRCECIVSEFQTASIGCNAPNSTLECSDKGTCVCGQCECLQRENADEVMSGRWCECDNFSCHRHGGEMCDGHGTCDCGRCVCIPPWTGEACECYNATNTCYPSFQENPKLCNGHGECVCGKCQCHSTDLGRYSGRHCERCPDCTATCDAMKPCVECQMYSVGPYDDDTCTKKCGDFKPEVVEVVEGDEQNSEFSCTFHDEDDCQYQFVYKKINETHYAVKAQRQRDCTL